MKKVLADYSAVLALIVMMTLVCAFVPAIREPAAQALGMVLSLTIFIVILDISAYLRDRHERRNGVVENYFIRGD